MTNTLKNIRESIAAGQLKRLKKEYEPLRKIDMSKHKGQVDKTTAMLSKLKIGTLIDLYKENIPWISDIAKSLVKKDKRFAHHVEEVEESIIMGLNKSSAEYKAGKEAAKKGIKYDANPHAPGVKRLNWSTGHNDFRADALRKAGKPNYGARGQFEELIREADLTKSQIKMVHDKADELPKNDFIKRYGKDGDAVRFATATNIVKKKLGIED